MDTRVVVPAKERWEIAREEPVLPAARLAIATSTAAAVAEDTNAA